MTQPLVSIITPARDTASWLVEAVASVRGQGFGDWELLLVNDGSMDDTGALIERLAGEDERIRPFQLATALGPAGARNTALEQARGRYIAFLDSDDLWQPDKLQCQLAFMEESGCAFSHTAYQLRIEASGRERLIRPRRQVRYRQLLNANCIAASTAIYDSQALGRVPMPLIDKRQDFGLWLKLLRQTDHALCLPEPLATIRKRPGSVSNNKLDALRYTWRLYRDHEHLNLPRRCWHFGNYLVRTSLKHL